MYTLEYTLINDKRIIGKAFINIAKATRNFMNKFNRPICIYKKNNVRYIDVSNTSIQCCDCLLKSFCNHHSPPEILEAEGVYLEKDVDLIQKLIPNQNRWKIIKTLSEYNGDLVETVFALSN
jgi:NACalpha-BTF3-like transcription factor